MTAHPHKLMRAHSVGKKNVILNRDVSGERNFVRKNIIVANHAVMRDVHANHEKVAGTDPRRLSRAIRPVKRAELADDVVVPDFQKTRLAFELHILRFATYNRMLKDSISGTQPRKPLDDGISPNLAIRPDFDVIFDNG